MRAALLVAAICCGLALAPARAQENKSLLATAISTCFPDNTSGQITPSGVRSCMTTFMNSWQQYAAVNAQTGTSYTIATTDYGQLLTFDNSGPVAVTLPQATGSFTTFNVYVTNLGTGTVTITPATSTINGASSFALTQNQSIWIVSDGTNYQVWRGLGTGFVNSGTANQLAYYAASGATVSGNANATISNGALTLGQAGSVVGSITFGNATSGTAQIIPVTGALGTAVATLPAGTYNLVGDALTQTLTNKTLNCGNNSCTVRIGSDVTGLGTGVATALGVNVGSAGAVVVNGGALGTPSSGTLTNVTGLPLSGVTGLGSGVSAALALPANANGGFPTYSSGTWTPTLIGSSSGAATYTTQVGSYEQIGRQVTARFTLVTASVSGIAGDALIGGLPVTVANTANDTGSCFVSRITGYTADSGYSYIGGNPIINTTTVGLYENGSGVAAQQFGAGRLAAATTLVGVCYYHS